MLSKGYSTWFVYQCACVRASTDILAPRILMNNTKCFCATRGEKRLHSMDKANMHNQYNIIPASQCTVMR